ncbi:unnamed protein product [Rhizoctonia solani]|uniref:TPX2 C-terminal domain-containing protein n=1 Tax=Rhizoctonia solani TaxID=456999 RepID=A0A8H3ARQ8_9AGAM|nr:unnamed protein product [Rhizoctonia solani]
MPREVFLEPSGSPFVQNTHYHDGDVSMTGDSTLTDLSFQDNNDNLLNGSGFAGLGDVTTGGIGEDTSMMNIQGDINESEDMLMGVKGDEFLEDDSMAFELSKSTTNTHTRSELEQSMAAVPIPPPAPAPAPAPVEEEKPKARRSTRSRSSSPSKKKSSAATVPVAEETTTFPVAPMEATTEEPEPEPEPEPKLRRSPRKAKSTSTRLGSSVSTGISPFASASSSPVPENPPPTETTQPTVPEPEPEPKSRRGSRVVGRSKSKSRAKNARVEEPLNEEPNVEESMPVAEPAATTPPVEREVKPIVREATPVTQESIPIAVRETTPVLLQHRATPPAPSPPAQNSSPAPSQAFPSIARTSPAPTHPTPPAVSPDVPPTGSWLAPANRQSLAPTPTSRQSLAPTPSTNSVPTGRQSLAPTPGPAPFKFNLPPSFGRRAQSLAPTPPFPTTPGLPSTPSFATISTPTISNPVSALPSPALGLATPGPAAAPRPATPEDKEEDLKYEQLSKEEEEEAVAVAMRITRRDSSIFATLLSPARPSLVPEPTLFAEHPAQEQQETHAFTPSDTIEEVPPTEPAPVPMRTRVGRSSTRVKGGAGVAVAVMRRVDEDMDMERVELRVGPQGQEQEHALREQHQDEPGWEQMQEVLEEDKHVLGEQQDPTASVNFGSRSPSPTPPPPPPGEPAPSVIAPPKNQPKPRTRTTRSSMPTVQPARVTRSTRRSEVQPPTTRGLGNTIKAKETLIEKLVDEMEIEEDTQNEDTKAATDVSTPTKAVDLPTGTIVESTAPLNPISTTPHDVISTTPIDSPAVSAPEGQAPASKPAVSKKAPVTKGTQRVLTRTVSAAAVSQQNASGSGSSQPQPRRTVSSGSTKPSSTGSVKPPSAEGSQQQTGRSAQKPISTKSTASQKPGSPGNQPPPVIHKEDVVDKEPSPVPEPVPTTKEPEPEPEPQVRAVRALPKRTSQPSKVPTIMEDSMEISRDDISVDIDAEQPTATQSTAPAFTAASIWPRDPAPNPFASVKVNVASHEDSSKANKRRAPSPDPEPESTPQDASISDSPNKRVRFTAILEAGPTPGIGRVLHMPKPSLKKIKKIKLERKTGATTNAARPKRVLTRNWVVGSDMPSYAAPLKRDVREREPATAERPPLTESQTNARLAASRSNPTVPIPFTFRSELRMKPRPVEDHAVPAAIPTAVPMPDFASAHAAAEAANLARRQRAHEAFLAAQEELESQRSSKFAIGGETARRAAERAVFDAAMRVKEAEAERVRNEQKRMQIEKEAAEIREMRRRMVPKANPIPQFYKHAPRTEAQDLEV